MDRKEEISAAYRSLGKAHSLYDGQMLGNTVTGRWMLKHIWQMTREDALSYPASVFSCIPADFSGKLLEVPVGTGVLSMPVWETMQKADITCLDYSAKMLQAAKERAQERRISHIRFMQGDVGALPFAEEHFDIVVSMNGFHAFPDKEAAWKETFRVLKSGGLFCGCFYVKQVNPHTDRWIKRFHEKHGFFTPPYETLDSLKERLESKYADVEVSSVKSIAVFQCVKSNLFSAYSL